MALSTPVFIPPGTWAPFPEQRLVATVLVDLFYQCLHLSLFLVLLS